MVWRMTDTWFSLPASSKQLLWFGIRMLILDLFSLFFSGVLRLSESSYLAFELLFRRALHQQIRF